MPFTTIKIIEGVFSREKKTELVQKVSEAMIDVTGEGMRDKTWVVIEEVKQGDWGIGGKTPSVKVE